MSTKTSFAGAVALSSMMAMTGCALETPITDARFGQSVRLMKISQTYDPTAASDPSPYPSMEGDGQRLEAVMEVYRSDVGRRAPEAGQDVVIDGRR